MVNSLESGHRAVNSIAILHLSNGIRCSGGIYGSSLLTLRFIIIKALSCVIKERI